LSTESVIIDWEIAARDEAGRSSFQLLQAYRLDQKPPLVHYAFDQLAIEDKDLRSTALVSRRRLLAKLLKKASSSQDPIF
jgi:bifunctional non-homologous end joining protein LigD